jgi:hypothetical protein
MAASHEALLVSPLDMAWLMIRFGSAVVEVEESTTSTVAPRSSPSLDATMRRQRRSAASARFTKSSRGNWTRVVLWQPCWTLVSVAHEPLGVVSSAESTPPEDRAAV